MRRWDLWVLLGLFDPLGFDFAQHRQTLRPSVDGIRSKALRLLCDRGSLIRAAFAQKPARAADPVYVKGEVFAHVGRNQNLKDLKKSAN